MSSHPEVPMSENDGLQQEQREHEMWLDEREKETVANLETNMERIFKQIFGGQS